MCTSIEEEIQSFSNDLAELKRIKINFYESLLRQGFDIRWVSAINLISNRQTGLMWIVRELWSLGEQIQRITLPRFLDDKAKTFVLKRAKFEQNMLEK